MSPSSLPLPSALVLVPVAVMGAVGAPIEAPPATATPSKLARLAPGTSWSRPSTDRAASLATPGTTEAAATEEQTEPGGLGVLVALLQPPPLSCW